ncbi:MAG: M48 family metallopeptidase [Syntrophobacterales bacterium]|nr:MAG: M48 family metallopeptidase [Syntrophobacterales bacterium]
MVQFNHLLIAFLVVFALRSLFQLTLNRLNVSHLRKKGGHVPRVFQGSVDGEKLARISAYTADSSNFGIVVTVFDQALLLAILLSGFLPWLYETINRWQPSFIIRGLAFFAVLAMISHLTHIPFALYSTFVIEDRYGFNTRTLKLWFSDWIKSIAISVILSGALLLLLLALLYHVSNTWWLWAWMAIGAFELIMLWAYPVVIAPLFNKFEPISNVELKDRIVSLMEKAGLRVRGVFQMDAGKRSKHTNAYFTGIGRTKRIVLFDTLLDSHPEEEILSVLAHEVGHWRKKHILKQLVVMEILSLIGLYLIAKMLHWPYIYQSFGFGEPVAYIGLILVCALLSPLGYFFRPIGSAISRRFEREADDAAVTLMGTVKPMRDALRRLAAENLANLVPHPIYAWFYYSHPPPVERISRLQHMEGGGP